MIQYKKISEVSVNMEFSVRVKQVRTKLNLSQTAFAKELEIGRATLIRWEKGEFKPNYDAQRKFEEYCKLKGIE